MGPNQIARSHANKKAVALSELSRRRMRAAALAQRPQDHQSSTTVVTAGAPSRSGGSASVIKSGDQVENLKNLAATYPGAIAASMSWLVLFGRGRQRPCSSSPASNFGGYSTNSFRSF